MRIKFVRLVVVLALALGVGAGVGVPNAMAQSAYLLSATGGGGSALGAPIAVSFAIVVAPGGGPNVAGLDLKFTRTHKDQNSTPYAVQAFPTNPGIVWESFTDPVLDLQGAGWQWSYEPTTIDTSISHGSDPAAKFVPIAAGDSALAFTIHDQLPVSAIVGDRVTYAVVGAESLIIGDDDVSTQFVADQSVEVVVVPAPCDLDGSGTVDSADVVASLRQNTGEDGVACNSGNVTPGAGCDVKDTRVIVKAVAGLGCIP